MRHPHKFALFDIDIQMLKSIVNKYLKAFLGEVFLNAPSAHLSIAADLFSDSNLRLDDLTFRPDIFDINLQPFRLISGILFRSIHF